MKKKVVIFESIRLVNLVVKSEFEKFADFFEEVGFSNPNDLKKDSILNYIQNHKNEIDLIIMSYFLTDSTFDSLLPMIREITETPIICLTSEAERDELIDILRNDENSYKVMKVDTHSILNVSAFILEMEKDLNVKFDFKLKGKEKKN